MIGRGVLALAALAKSGSYTTNNARVELAAACDDDEPEPRARPTTMAYNQSHRPAASMSTTNLAPPSTDVRQRRMTSPSLPPPSPLNLVSVPASLRVSRVERVTNSQNQSTATDARRPRSGRRPRSIRTPVRLASPKMARSTTLRDRTREDRGHAHTLRRLPLPSLLPI